MTDISEQDVTVREGDLFAFYGILTSDTNLGEIGTFMVDCRIPGNIYSVHDSFPALMLDDEVDDVLDPAGYPSTVVGRVWRVPEDPDLRSQVVWELDTLEGFIPDQPWNSMYLRQRVELVEPAVSAWVYVWNGRFDNMRQITSGDWRMDRDRQIMQGIKDVGTEDGDH
jgi:gamma-glutamylcyclotransferase (GGCT)/AIG2-like uncharacterized protein YtfP